jgi:hypothetical protein
VSIRVCAKTSIRNTEDPSLFAPHGMPLDGPNRLLSRAVHELNSRRRGTLKTDTRLKSREAASGIQPRVKRSGTLGQRPKQGQALKGRRKNFPSGRRIHGSFPLCLRAAVFPSSRDAAYRTRVHGPATAIRPPHRSGLSGDVWAIFLRPSRAGIRWESDPGFRFASPWAEFLRRFAAQRTALHTAIPKEIGSRPKGTRMRATRIPRERREKGLGE